MSRLGNAVANPNKSYYTQDRKIVGCSVAEIWNAFRDSGICLAWKPT